VINYEKLGMSIRAIINITLKPNRQKEFLAFANTYGCILECHHVTGGYSMTIKALFREISELEMLVGKIQQYGNTQTLMILSTPIDNRGIL
jgi:Lrp/AsnC family leucine-responsive transcriptional regulator